VNQVGLVAAVPVNFIHGYYEFLVNGVSQPWSGNLFFGPTMSSPVPGLSGTGVGNTIPFVSPFPAGPLPNLGAYIHPYSGYLYSAGIDPTLVNGYTQALEFAPQTPAVPEPSTWAMMFMGFAGLGVAGHRRAQRARAAA
jgi:hypothetical protein